MDWITIIIVVISISVWALANLANMNKKQPQIGQAANAGPRNRPSATEIDRFLEEVNRRKQQQQERRASAPPPVQKQPPKKVVAVEAKKVKAPQRKVVVGEPVVQAIVLGEPVTPSPILAPSLAALSTIQVPPTIGPRSGESRYISQVKTMLKSQDGLRSMFVVNEILGAPRCRKPRRV
jgi:hypothetical protein